MKLKLMIIATLLPTLLVGCWEDEKKLLDFARNEIRPRSLSITALDASARYSQAFMHGIDSVQQKVIQLDSLTQPMLNSTLTALSQIELDQSLLQGRDAKELLKNTRDLYFKTYDSYISSSNQLIIAGIETEKLGISIQYIKSLCDSYGRADHTGQPLIIKPADVAGLTASLGGKAYNYYISISVNSNGSIANVSTSENQFKEALEYFAKQVFAPTDIKNLPEAIYKILQQNMLTDQERAGIAIEQCNNSYRELNISEAIAQLEVLQLLLLTKIRFAQAQEISLISSLYEKVKVTALQASEYHLDDVDRTMKAIYHANNLMEKAAGLDRLAYAQYSESYLLFRRGDCENAKNLLNSTESLIEEFRVFVSQNTNDRDFMDNVSRGVDRINDLEKQINRFKERFSKRCP